MAVRALIVIVLVAASGFYARDLRGNRTFTEALPRLADLPAEFEGWNSQTYPFAESINEVLGADTVLRRRYYRLDGTQVWLFVAYFADQEVNSQIHSPRHCVPGSGWRIADLEPTEVPTEGGVLDATRMKVEREGLSQELVYWFRTRSGTVAGEYALKWDLIKNSLARRPTDAVFVRYVAKTEDADAMRSLMADLDAPLNRILGEVGLR